MTPIIASLTEISVRYDAVFCDLWGCLHDGLKPFTTAVEALTRFKAGGGTVVLLTNSPRPRAGVEKQLDQIGVPRGCWDVITTSGDSARYAMFQGVVGQKIYHIGTPFEVGFFEPLRLMPDAVPVERVPLKDADGIVCTGPFDSLAHPDVNRPDFLYAKTKGLKLLCANPDIVVDRGDSREWCAGALAKLYTDMGGTSLYFGKPHPPIYDLARRRLAQIRPVPDDSILCIGDGIHTDIQGGMGENLDTLFITGGLAAADMGADRNNPDQARLDSYIAAHQLSPTYAIGLLR